MSDDTGGFTLLPETERKRANEPDTASILARYSPAELAAYRKRGMLDSRGIPTIPPGTPINSQGLPYAPDMQAMSPQERAHAKAAGKALKEGTFWGPSAGTTTTIDPLAQYTPAELATLRAKGMIGPDGVPTVPPFWSGQKPPRPLTTSEGGPGFSSDAPAKPSRDSAQQQRDRVVQFWIGKGAPPHVAEGIADRLEVESGINPAAWNPNDNGSPSGGMYQHHADRLTKLKAFAAKQNKPWNDPDVQNEFAYSEVTGGDPQASIHWKEILASPDRKAANQAWTKNFERPAGSGSPESGGFSVIGADKWRVSDRALATEQSRKNTSVVWMSPDDYLAMTPEIDAGDARPKRRSLMKSLDAGDEIESIPSLEATTDKGRLKFTDQDGRNRALAAKAEGVDQIPVAIHGVSGELPGWAEDMRGAVRRFDHAPVALAAPLLKPPIADASPQQQIAINSAKPAEPPTPAGELWDSVRDIGRVPAGLADRVVLGAENLVRMGIGAQPVDSDIPIEPGLSKLGDIGTFLTGGLMSPIGVAAPVANTARGLANVGPEVARVAPAPMSAPVANFLSGVRQASGIENKAREAINTRYAQDLKADAPAPPQVAAELARGRGEGMALVDQPLENVRGLVGGVAREPGPGRNRLARWAANRLGDIDRDSPIGQNLERSIEANLATGSARTEAKALAEQRSQSKPLWDAAMAGGNLPPVPRQIARDYGEAERGADKAKAAYDKEAEKLAQMERAARDQSVTVPQAPTRLSTFLIRNGGLKDEGTEVSYILGSAKGRPGLMNKGGRSLDDAALEAWEAGYLPGSERPSIDDLLNALAQDINMAPVYSELDADMAAANRAALHTNSETTRRATERPGPQGQRVTPRQLQFQRDKTADLEASWKRADEEKAELVGVLQAATADGTAGLPGAVYSPQLGRLLKNPRVKQGLNRGARIERDLADAEGRRFNTRDYAIIGEDASGDPIVGAVPNMKLLAVAKEGLDATLESPAMRDELTGRLNKEGRAVKMLRDSLVGELDRLNPAYKTARDKWAGDSALIAAIREGKQFHKQSPEEIAEWFVEASDSEKQFYRLGASDTLRDDLQKRVFAGDPSKAIVNSPRARNQLLPMFRSKEDADTFLEGVKRARQMFNTPVELLGNSKTAAREAEDIARKQGLETAADLLHGVASAASGHPGGLLYRAGRIGLRHANPFAPSQQTEQAVNNAIVRLTTDPNLRVNATPGQELLRRLPLPHVQNAFTRGALRAVPPMFRQRPPSP